MLVDDLLGLYAVADGMGGHQAGEVASQLTVDTLEAHVGASCNIGRKSAPPGDKRLSCHANRLLSGIRESNQVVHTTSRTNQAFHGMGTTVAAVLLSDDSVIAANVGDSIIYLVRSGEISQISVLHTLLAEKTALDPEVAERLGRQLSHVLTRAIGTHADVKVDLVELQCFADDILVISSDGLTDKVSPDEIREIVQAGAPKTACRRLVDLANERGGDDNITVVVIKVKQVKRNSGRCLRLWRALTSMINHFAPKRRRWPV